MGDMTEPVEVLGSIADCSLRKSEINKLFVRKPLKKNSHTYVVAVDGSEMSNYGYQLAAKLVTFHESGNSIFVVNVANRTGWADEPSLKPKYRFDVIRVFYEKELAKLDDT